MNSRRSLDARSMAPKLLGLALARLTAACVSRTRRASGRAPKDREVLKTTRDRPTACRHGLWIREKQVERQASSCQRTRAACCCGCLLSVACLLLAPDLRFDRACPKPCPRESRRLQQAESERCCAIGVVAAPKVQRGRREQHDGRGRADRLQQDLGQGGGHLDATLVLREMMIPAYYLLRLPGGSVRLEPKI